MSDHSAHLPGADVLAVLPLAKKQRRQGVPFKRAGKQRTTLITELEKLAK